MTQLKKIFFWFNENKVNDRQVVDAAKNLIR